MSDGQQFLATSRAFLNEEYRIKLRRAVLAMPEEALWWRPNAESNSVGNLLLHLAGNVRQWIVSGIGGAPDSRNRASEFAAREGATREQLLAYLETILGQADAVVGALAESDLAARRTVQGRDVTVLEALYTTVQHFAMHLGQIILIAKHHAPGAIRFYEDAGGLARPIWR
jgi:uncharacterized damage-inducible protein DinB